MAIEQLTAFDKSNTPIDYWGKDASRLYYEAHVTIPPLTTTEQQEFITQLCAEMGWRQSTFVLHSHGLVPNAFISARHHSRNVIIGMMQLVLEQLQAAGYQVLRWKIEDTLLDSKHGDRLVPKGGSL